MWGTENSWMHATRKKVFHTADVNVRIVSCLELALYFVEKVKVGDKETAALLSRRRTFITEGKAPWKHTYFAATLSPPGSCLTISMIQS